MKEQRKSRKMKVTEVWSDVVRVETCDGFKGKITALLCPWGGVNVGDEITLSIRKVIQGGLGMAQIC